MSDKLDITTKAKSPQDKQKTLKTLIFSDSHLTEKFDYRKYKFLEKIINEADKVVINGDFWDGYKTTFDKFVNSQWAELFPMLKSKNAVYIYGNHDKRELNDDRMSLFSHQQTYSYTLETATKKLIFAHGNTIRPALDEMLPKLNWFIDRIHIGDIFKNTILMIFGPRGIKTLNAFSNKKIKNWIKKNLAEAEILFCGHTHVQEINLDLGFVNSGFVEHGYGQYVMVLDDEIRVYNEKY